MMKIIYRQSFDGAIALFPEQKEGKFIQSYSSTGQHSLANPDLIKELPKPTWNDVISLMDELNEIGYQDDVPSVLFVQAVASYFDNDDDRIQFLEDLDEETPQLYWNLLQGKQNLDAYLGLFEGDTYQLAEQTLTEKGVFNLIPRCYVDVIHYAREQFMFYKQFTFEGKTYVVTDEDF